MYSLNCLVATEGNLWALRYPDQRALHVARRRIDPDTGAALRTGLTQHTVRADEPAEVVIVASERIDGGQDWRMLEPGELIHVGPDLSMTSRLVLDHPPAHLHLLDEADPNIDTF
jgi:glutamine amidotransferase